MSELDTLRPEVREAVAAIDGGNGVFVNADDCIGSEKWKIVRAELLRLAEIEKERWGVVATRNAAIERAYKAEAELAALRARIAASRLIEPCVQWPIPGYVGKRVRLLVDEPQDDNAQEGRSRE